MPRGITWLLTSMYYTPDRLPIDVQWGFRSGLKDDHVIFSYSMCLCFIPFFLTMFTVINSQTYTHCNFGYFHILTRVRNR